METNNWQNVTKILPKNQEMVVILLNNKFPVVAKFNGIEFTEDGLDFENVTHWLRLPELPKD